MRRLLLLTVFLLVMALVVLPTVMGRLFGRVAAPTPTPDGADHLSVKVYFPEFKQIESIALGDYLKGVVAAEMPAEFETEALKAQFVVARTYTVRRMQQFRGQGNGGCPLQPSADVCADPATSQAYMTRDQVEKKLGKVAADALWKRLGRAQAETAGLVLTYKGDLIDPLYHSVSGTRTEDSGEYFGQSLPYLKPVDDHWGADSPKLLETRRFTPAEIAQALTGGGKAVRATTSVRVVSKTNTGRVKTMDVSGVQFTGREFRERMGLRSTDFTVGVQNGQVVVQTRGYGHGIGMSQYGANGMAKVGKSFSEILSHYYSGVRITQIFEE